MMPKFHLRFPMKPDPRFLLFSLVLSFTSCGKGPKEAEPVVETVARASEPEDGPPAAAPTHEEVFRKIIGVLERMISALEQSGDINEAVGRLAVLEPECRSIAELGKKIGEADAETAERFHGQLQAALGPITVRSRKAVAKLLGHDPFSPDAEDITPADQKRLMADVSRIDAAVGQLVGYFEEAFPIEEEHDHEGEADSGTESP